MNETPDIWAVVPAAGTGRRMGSSVAKQYLPLLGKSVLEHCLQKITGIERVKGLIVAIHPDDTLWPTISVDTQKTVLTTVGGEERVHSVIRALETLVQHNEVNTEYDWVLVHDAVRPCVKVADIQKLIKHAMTTEDGGILAVPVKDTIKQQADAQKESTTIKSTIDRTTLWYAQTPQLFPLLRLLDALKQCVKQAITVTDDASAMEASGFHPRLVAGSVSNIKITHLEDLKMAELLLEESA